MGCHVHVLTVQCVCYGDSNSSMGHASHGRDFITSQTKLHQQLCRLSNWSNLNNKTSGQTSVHHARMRMDLSALNAQRRKYNFIMTIRVFVQYES